MNTINDNVKEVWKIIEDYPKYQVSNLGRVRNIRTGNIVYPRATKRGYYRVALYDGGEFSIKKSHGKDIFVHLLVMKAFTTKPEGNYEVDHINLNKFDNRLENLRWVTHKENVKTRSTSRLVGKYSVKTGELIQVFETFQDAVDDSGLKSSTLRRRIYNNKTVKLYTIYKFL